MLEGQARDFHEAMKQFELTAHFGLEYGAPDAQKGTPVHVNTRKKPRGSTKFVDSKWGDHEVMIRVPRCRTPQIVCNHLQGSRAYFHLACRKRKSSSKSSNKVKSMLDTSLHALDFDSKTALYQTSHDYAKAHIAELLPGLASFIEPSRSYNHQSQMGGCYLWFRVQWESMDLAYRNKLLHALGRELKSLLPEIKGVQFDNVKGTFSYVIKNPKYKSSIGSAPGRGRYKYEVLIDGHWKCAMKMVRKELKDREIRKYYGKTTIQEDYESLKSVYGIARNGMDCDYTIRFPFDVTLEKKIRHCGTLVTAPCYKALSGTRPNNMTDFIQWLSTDSGVITEKDILAIVGTGIQSMPEVDDTTDDCNIDETNIEDMLSDVSIETPSGYAESMTYVHDSFGRTKVARMFLDKTQSQFDRYRAAGWMAIGKHGIADRWKIEEEMLQLVELPCGPATGDRDDDRLDEIARVTDWCIQNYHRQYGCTDRFNDSDVEAMIPYVKERIASEEIIKACASKKAVVNEHVLAYTLCIMLKLIGRNASAEVPSRAIGKWLRKNKIIRGDTGIKRSTVSVAMELLINPEAGLIIRTKNHFHGERGSKAATYAIHARCPTPAWCSGAAQTSKPFQFPSGEFGIAG